MKNLIKSLCLGFFSVWLLAVAATAQSIGPSAARDLLQLNAHDVALEDAERWLRTPELEDPVLRIAWISAASGLFEADEVMELTAIMLGDTLDLSGSEMLRSFFSSSVGQQVTNAEKETQQPGYDTQSALLAGLDLFEAATAERKRALERLYDAFDRNRGVDLSEAVAVSARYAVIKAALLQRGEMRSDEMILGLAAQNMSRDAQRDRSEAIRRYAFTYRDISDAALADYAAALESEAGLLFYTAVNAGYETVFIRDLVTFRERLATGLSAEEL